MKIPVWLITLLTTTLIAEQGWLVTTVIDIKADLAYIKGQMVITPSATTK